jgi:choline dehydrogenase-like flavoprotein
LNGNAASEVIVSAGALGSPQLLMLSGIGPADHLSSFNIPTVVNNSAVGSLMADNPTNSVWVLTRRRVETTLIQVVGITSFGSYIEVASGQAQLAVSNWRATASESRDRTVLPSSRLSKDFNPTAATTTAFINPERGHASPKKLNNDSVTAASLYGRIYGAIAALPRTYQARAAYGGSILQKVWACNEWGEFGLNQSQEPSVVSSMLISFGFFRY